MSKLSAFTPTFISTIQSLKQSQHEREQEWDTRRCEIETKYAARIKMNSLLQQVASGVEDNAETYNENNKQRYVSERNVIETEMAQELGKQDLRVWLLHKDLVEVHQRELAKLGVPYFRSIDEQSMEMKKRMMQFLNEFVE